MKLIIKSKNFKVQESEKKYHVSETLGNYDIPKKDVLDLLFTISDIHSEDVSQSIQIEPNVKKLLIKEIKKICKDNANYDLCKGLEKVEDMLIEEELN